MVLMVSSNLTITRSGVRSPISDKNARPEVKARQRGRVLSERSAAGGTRVRDT